MMEKPAEKPEKSAFQKMRLKPGHQIQVFGNPSPRPEEWIEANTTEKPDAVLVYLHNQSELDGLLDAIKAATSSKTLLWLLYPKGNKTFNRDTLYTHLKPLGLEGIGMVSVDRVWSAMRFKVLD
ncbi:hypothetical protein [Deinococcus roseus]|uniref:DUF3052 domain-containing protein n=1 Tax=Deinococcus roseus TaxID=392414 RepID=A0ABQ2D1C1_9DEIO|nr:hypothetical protein [Deinococcus roseus]GGJ39890.1 hypothetical protein GCM10008938_27380 [Deinococcus roseus]